MIQNVKFEFLSELHVLDKISSNIKLDVTANVILKDNSLNMTALLDTGANGPSYFPLDMYMAYRDILEPYTQNCDFYVTLGDSKTQVHISKRIKLDIELVSQCNGRFHEHLVTSWFYIIPGHSQIIVGLFLILTKLSDFFIQIFNELKDKALKSLKPIFPEYSLCTIIPHDNIQSKLEQFQEFLHPEKIQHTADYSNLDAEAFDRPFEPYQDTLEETMIPDISLDPLGLCYMETTYDEALQDYFKVLDTHVQEDFRNDTNILELLKGKGRRVFVPDNWKGITDLVLDLEFKEDMPVFFKPPQKRYNPLLIDRVKPELQRLAATVWEKSNSDICSPILIADKATAPFYRICGMYNIFVNKYIKTGHAPIPQVHL